MAYNNSDFAITLPQTLGNPGDVWKDAMNRKERQQERNDALSERQREFEQRNQLAKQEKDRTNRLYNLKQIQDATNQKQYETPNHIIDNTLGQELQNIRGEAMKYIGESPEFVTQLITDKVAKVSQWADLAKQHAQQISQQTVEFNKTLPNTDLNKVTGLTSQQFKDNFFNKDEKGNYTGLKDPHLIQQNANYFDQFNDENKLASVVNSQQPLYDFFKNMPKYPIEGNSYKSNKGAVIQKAYKGFTTPYTDEVTGDENKLELRPKSHIVHIGDNEEPIRVADESLKKAMVANPAVEAAFTQAWKSTVNEKGLQNTNPHALDILKEAFRYKFAEDQMSAMHQVNFKDKEIIPKPARITINTGNGSKEITFNNVADQVDGALAQQGITPITALPSEAREYFVNSVNKGRNDANHLNVDKLGVVKANNGTYRILDLENDGEVAGVFSRTGTNLGTNKTQKVQQKILKEESRPYNSYSINGKSYTHDELLKMGYKDDQIQQALKLGTIKHK